MEVLPSGPLSTFVLYLNLCPSWLIDPDSSLELQARWTVFTTPLKHVIQLQDNAAGALNGCVLCVSEDGTVAVIVVDGLQL